MSLFNNILLDLTNRLKGKESTKEEISKIISKEVGINIEVNTLQINNDILFINTSPTIKSAILFKKQKILESLEKYNIYSIG